MSAERYSNSLQITFAIFCVIVLFLFLLRLINKNRGIQSKKDGNNEIQIVADAPNNEKSVQLLAEIKSRLRYLISYCIQNYPDNPNVRLLNERFDPNNVQEASLYESGTSYTIDKGKELHMCLRDKNSQHMRHHDINILMFVAIHELSHIMSVSYGHNVEFGENFKFLLEKAVECNVYVPENYAQNPVQFCGITVEASPLFG